MQYGGIEKTLASIIERAVNEVFTARGIQPFSSHELKSELEIPKDRSHGDLSTNIAMRGARIAKISPLDLAGLIKIQLGGILHELDGAIDRVEIKNPGFINFFIGKDYLCKVLLEIKREKHNFGRSSVGRGIKLQVEFVSANPTGPLTIAHGRQAAIGDSLANILEFLGYNVTREYYLNDEGTQMNILGNSIRVRYLELFGPAEPFPQDGYKGAYVTDIAKDFKKNHGKKHIKTTDIKVFR